MRVFFTGSTRDATFNKELFVKLYQIIEKLGYEHIDHQMLHALQEEVTTIRTREDNIKRYQEKVEGIKRADICVFEASAHSLETGFLINIALEQQKPTIVFYYDSLVPYFLEGVDHEKLLVRNYDEKNIAKVVSDVLEQAREKRDKRFNFFISPKLLEFLEQASTAEGITKSKYIRNMIVEHMRENKKEVFDASSSAEIPSDSE